MIGRNILDRIDEQLDASEPPKSRLLVHLPPLRIDVNNTSGITDMTQRALLVGNEQVDDDSLIHFLSKAYQYRTCTKGRYLSKYIS